MAGSTTAPDRPTLVIGKLHLDQMRHAVGFFSESPGFRNYFGTEKCNPVWSLLEQLGLASGRPVLGAHCFHLTEAGKQLIGLPEQMRMAGVNDEQ